MNLLVVTHYYPAHGGGIEAIAGQLVQHFLALDPGVNIEWHAGRGDAHPPRQKRLRFRPLRVWNGIEQSTGLPIPIPSLRALGQLWRAVRKADVVHFHDLAYPAHIVLALFCALQRKPYVVTQHIGFVPFQSPVFRAILTGVNRYVGSTILGRSARVVFYSEEVRRYFGSLGICQASERVLFIPNGVDGAVFHPAAPATRLGLREKLARSGGYDPSRLLVLFVGRFVEKKGVLFLAELSKRFPDVQWVFAGQGPLDPENHLGPNATVLRGLRGAQVAELYQAADLLVLPSRGEGFPLVVQEALACGTPVLVETALSKATPSATPWMNLETLGAQDDAARWETRLRQLLEELPEPPEARTRRAEFAAREWSWEQAATAYLECFADVLAEKGKRH